MNHRFFIALILVLTVSCTPRYYKSFVHQDDILVQATGKSNNRCDKIEAYIPDEYTPMRFVRVNFHFMYDGEGGYNFPANQAKAYIRDLLEVCNNKLANNTPMNLPEGNNTPALPTRYRLVLAGNEGEGGIYFHQDDTACFFAKNTRSGRFSETDQGMFKYSVGVDTIINIYMIEHHPDSLISNPNYNVTASGISYGHNIKIFGAYYNASTTFYSNEGKSFHKGAGFYSGLVNHEVGHTLGLPHSWNTDDGCEDTPKNPGCWSPGAPPCDGVISNNMMDYNGCQCAISPCQLGKIHYNFSRNNSRQRTVLQEKWCNYDPYSRIIIPRDQTIVFNGSRDFNSDLIVEEGATLIVQCTISMPKGSKVIVKPGAKLIIDGGLITNLCQEEWEGIEVWESRKFDLKGTVHMTNKGRIDQAVHYVESDP